jgi:transposase
MTLGRTDTALGAYYRRMAARLGAGKAVAATARKLAVMIYNMLRNGTQYVDPGANNYDHRQRQRILKSLGRRAKALGYELVTAEPAPATS